MRLIYFVWLAFLLAACGTVQPTAVPGIEVRLGTEPVVEAGTFEVGEPVPELVFMLDGTQRRLSDYQGKHVIVNFWETTCLPCRTEMPDFQTLVRERADVVVLAVNRRENPSLVEQFGQQYGLTFPLLLDRTGDVSQAFGVTTAIPTSFFINPEGMLEHIQVGVMTKGTMSRLLDQS